MGFEQSAISSIKGNRSLQRKQSAFYTPETEYIGEQLLIDKLLVDEKKMQKIARRSNLREAIFYAIVIMIALGSVYRYWM